ncbi:hypothetical protein ACFL35_08505 [Candidatus Riflebacteria bacterium]
MMALALRKEQKKENEKIIELEKLIQRLGVDLEYRKLTFDGGLCFIQKRPHLILNRELTLQEKARQIVKALQKFKLEEIFIPEGLRTVVQDISAELKNIE